MFSWAEHNLKRSMQGPSETTAAGSDSEESFEKQFSTTAAGALFSVLSRLAATWRARRLARRIAADLPEYDSPVPLPDSDTIYAWLEELCETPHRRPGTPEGHRAEKWVAEKLRNFGIENVRQDPIPISVWSADRCSLRVGERVIPSFYVVNTGFTAPEGVTAPMAYVRTGTPDDFQRASVSGKIVVADVSFPVLPTGFIMRLLRACYILSDPDRTLGITSRQRLNFVRQNFLGGATAATAPDNDVYWQAVRREARGICLILRDQPSNSNTHYGPYDGIMKPLPGLWIGKRDGHEIRHHARAGATATLTLEGQIEPGTTHNVWGVLPGQSEEVILVTSHHDSPFGGATEDGAGVVQVLAQAHAWAQVPKEHRPKTLVFVIDAGHFYGSIGAEAFAKTRGDILDRTRILLTLEHLGAKHVEADGEGYAETGDLALTVMFTTPDPMVVATVIRALERKPAKVTASIPSNFFGPVPTSDAMEYVMAAPVPVISWIGCPYYLLDAHDTLDKVAKSELGPICETVAELVKTHMAL
jgi:peptidase M28-like protein